MTTRNFEASGFREIELRGTGHLAIEQAGHESVAVEASDEAMEKIEVKVEHDKLILGFKHKWYDFDLWTTATYRDTKFRVGVKDVEEITLTGSGDVTSGKLNADKLKVSIKGSGKMTLAVVAGKLKAHIAGSGNIAVSGTADETEVDIDGSGDYLARELAGKAAQVNIRGSGNAELQVADRLDIAIYGVGEVRYAGNPEVSQRVFGAGKVVRLKA